MLERLRHKGLNWWSAIVSHYPRTILAVALLVSVASIAITVSNWHFQSNRNALLSEDLDWNQRFLQWTRSFPGTADLTVVIDSGPAPRTPAARSQARALADELGQALQNDTAHVERVVWRFDINRTSPRTIRVLDPPEFDHRALQLEQLGPVLASPTPEHLLQHVLSRFAFSAATSQAPDDVEGAIAHLTQLIEAIGTSLGDAHAGQPFQLSVPNERRSGEGVSGPGPWQYLVSDNQRLFFLRVTPHESQRGLSAQGDAIERIRDTIATIARRYPLVEAGLTGIEAIEHDETAAVQRDSTIATIVAFILIAVLLVSAFHSVRTPLLALTALAFALSWSFGFLFLTVGHLQVLSVFFTVILLGLGVAYGIHLVSRFELVRHDFPDGEAGFATTLRNCLQTTGPGIVTGAFTTAAAFATTVFTKFTGVAEMGFIAAAGIVLCLIAMFSVFPALLRLFKRDHHHVVPMKHRRFHLVDERWVAPLVRHPRTTLAIAAVITIGSGLVAATRMRYDYNLESLLPRNVDSVQWQRRIVQGGQSIYAAVSIVDDLDQARRRAHQFRALPLVGEVRGIGLLVPPDDARKIQVLQDIRQRLGASGSDPLNLPEVSNLAAAGPDLGQQLGFMKTLAQESAARIPEDLKPKVDALGAAVDRTLGVLDALPPETRAQRLADLQAQYTRWRKRIASVFDPSPLTTEDLPAELLDPYRNARGQLALEVHPRLPGGKDAPTSPLDPRFLPAFVQSLEAVDPTITGVIVQYYKSGTLIFTSYCMAGLYALGIVFAVVWIDFRRIADAALSLVPVCAGFAVTFGVMYVLGMSINAANIIVLPLMFGIGVDSGVHMIHRYRQDPVTRPLGLTAGTGKGITITCFTAMIGFGAMMLAEHRGIFSLGFVLTVGIGMTLLSCWTIMPAWLELRTRRSVSRRPWQARPAAGKGHTPPRAGG